MTLPIHTPSCSLIPPAIAMDTGLCNVNRKPVRYNHDIRRYSICDEDVGRGNNPRGAAMLG